MSKKLEGKVAIVTGGADGIGKGISECLVKAGCAVVMAQRRKDILEKTEKELKAMGGEALSIVMDISDEQQVINMVKQAHDWKGRLDILVNNIACTGPVRSVVDMDLKEWNDAIAIILTGNMLCSREALKYMIPAKRGNIVNIGAEAMRLADGWGGYPHRASYMSTKLAVQAMQAAIALEVGQYGIRINSLSPALVNAGRALTVMKAYADKMGITLEERLETEKSRYSLRRVTEPEDVGNAVVFLASDDAIAITNQTISVTSGMCMNADQIK